MKYDVCVIGGGPAGMMAAGQLGEQGYKVVLLEKNNSLGVKLLMTGHGRCNFTNAEPDLKKLIAAYGKNGKFLYSAFNNFSNQDTLNFFTSRGVNYKIENNNRVLTASNNAQVILDCLKKYLADNKVEVKYNHPVKKLVAKNNKIIKADGIIADNFVLATGGKSYPASGSTGDAYAWLKKLGHTIVEPRPSLSPIIVKEDVSKLEGYSLRNAEFTLWDKKKIAFTVGDAVFTAAGLSGPAIFSLSRQIKPNQKLEIICTEASQIKKFPTGITFNLKGLVGFSKAVITVGGVSLKEVDPKTMKSKIIDNLYFAGEILDLDGPTGGYNLQVAWSTAQAIRLA